MSTDTVTVDAKQETMKESVPQEMVAPIVESVEQSVEEPQVNVEDKEEQKVPLSALQKERRKRQEVEQRNKILEEIQLRSLQSQPSPQQQDDTQYEAVTKADLEKSLEKTRTQTVRDTEERMWIKQNPEKAELIKERLPEFLQQRPNLVHAIDAATNRYEEAWELMDKLSPKQKAALKPKAQTTTNAPGSPAAVSKGAALNQSVDVMSMTDAEFAVWRKAQRKVR